LFLKKIKSAPHRAILLAGLAAPAGASLAEIGITRTLSFVIPAGLLIAFGIDWLMERSRRWIPERALALAVALGLAAASVSMLHKSLTDGPTWFSDYGLYGMQYGATQLFEDVIPRALEEDPATQIYLTSSWANASDRFIAFFLPGEQRARVVMEGIQTYTFKKMPLSDNIKFIMSAGELKLARESNKFKTIDVLETVPYPDGSPGFYVVRLAYVDDIEQVFAREKEERKQLIEDQVTVGGQELTVRHSMLDMGVPALIFDQDDFTLMRGLEANPFVLEVEFPAEQAIASVYLDCGTINMQVMVTVYPPDGRAESTVKRFANLPVGATRVEIPLESGARATRKLRVEILASDYPAGAAVNVHVREFGWQPFD
jgi:hypothetical protein